MNAEQESTTPSGKPAPVEMVQASKLVQQSLSMGRQAVVEMFSRSGPAGFDDSIVARLREMDAPRAAGDAAPAAEVTRALTVMSLASSQAGADQPTAKALAAASERSQELTAIVLQAALAEQQNVDHSLRGGRERFDARELEQTLDDWILRGAHRQGKERAPLSEIARFIDSREVALHAVEVRFGCVVPIVAAVHFWCLLQQHDLTGGQEQPSQPGAEPSGEHGPAAAR